MLVALLELLEHKLKQIGESLFTHHNPLWTRSLTGIMRVYMFFHFDPRTPNFCNSIHIYSIMVFFFFFVNV